MGHTHRVRGHHGSVYGRSQGVFEVGPVNRALRVVLLVVLIGSSTASAQPGHFPSRETWEKRKPADVGMDERLLADAIAFAKVQETDRPKDLSDQVRLYGRLIGPMPKDRG